MIRVWTYVIGGNLSEEELDLIRILGRDFVNAWTAHEQRLSASFEIYKNKIIVVKVNEEIHSASGCGIDKLTRFVKELENKFSLELMNRMLVALKKDDHIEVHHANEIKGMLCKKLIDENTIVYNTSVSNNEELIRWEQPLKDTWLGKYLEEVK